jgi:hypothetical protein
MPREIPKELYDQVFSLVTAIAQPDAKPLAEADEVAASNALAELTELLKRRQDAGQSDPFLTEALADYVKDDAEAIRLYHLALAQCAATPGEPTHTKRVGLCRRLVQAGRKSDASAELARARCEAFAASDADSLSELEEIAAGLAV